MSRLPGRAEARAMARDLQDDLWGQASTEVKVRGLAGHLADMRLLTHAAEMVLRKKTENHPGIPGVDEETRAEFLDNLEARLLRLHEELRSGIYRPGPLRKEKLGGRVVQVRCWRDRVVEQAIVLLVEPLFRSRLHDGALGWRNGCNQAMAVDRVTPGLQICDFVIVLDIFECFDTIRHADVMSALREVIRNAEFLRVIKSLLVTGVVGEAPKNTDIHQGTTLAPLLANIVLSRIDHVFAPGWGVPGIAKNYGHTNSADDITADKSTPNTTAKAKAKAKAQTKYRSHSEAKNAGHKPDTDEDHNHGHHQEPRGSSRAASSSSASPITHQPGWRIGPAPLCLYSRYGDDFVVPVQGSRVQAEQVKDLIDAGLLDIGLSLSGKKTWIGTPEEGFTFLGLDIRLGENGHLIKLVPQSKIEEWASHVRKQIRKEGLRWSYRSDGKLMNKERYFRDLGADMADARRRLSEALGKP